MVELMTRSEIATYLHLKPSSVCTYVKQKAWNKVPPPVHFGTTYLWKADVVDQWIDEHQIGLEAKPERNPSV